MLIVLSFILGFLEIVFFFTGITLIFSGFDFRSELLLFGLGFLCQIIRWAIKKHDKKESAVITSRKEAFVLNTPGNELLLKDNAECVPPSAPEQPMEPESIRPCIMDGMAFLKSHASHYVAFDLETTGLSPQSDAIIEIGAVKVKDGDIVETFSTFVHPGRHIPEAATAVNHITDDMVNGAPGIAQALSLFQAFVGNLPCVAHNCDFDSGFLAASGMNPLPSFADSLQMARRLFPGLPNKKLATVCEAIGYEIGQAHRALDDAKAVHAIVQACAARAASLEEGERARKRHDKLTIAINQAYSVARESADPSSAQMDGILSMCREDFALVPTVREYCAMNAYPDPVFDSFRRAAIILAQRKDYEGALLVCDQAVALGIPDTTTEGGFPARIARLQRQKNQRDERQAAQLARDQTHAEKEAKKQEKAAKTQAGSGKRPVRQYSPDGASLIREFESVAAAARETGISPKGIRDAANGVQRTSGGFAWKYAQEQDQ